MILAINVFILWPKLIHLDVQHFRLIQVYYEAIVVCFVLFVQCHNFCSKFIFFFVARFSPDDRYANERIMIKKRFGLLLTQRNADGGGGSSQQNGCTK